MVRLQGIEINRLEDIVVENRAKQFMPFAALKGYEEALRAKNSEW